MELLFRKQGGDRTMRKIQILGTGCPKCKQLTANAEQAAQVLGIEYEIEKVTDVNQIVGFGVMTTPALAVDGQVKVAGKVASPEEIRALLR
jgi:small redox-active disulfide protein 2